MTLSGDGDATRVALTHRVVGEVAEEDRAGFTDRWPRHTGRARGEGRVMTRWPL